MSATELPRVLLAAGEWGYGPAATADMIACEIGGMAQVDVLGSGAAAEYASMSHVLGGRLVGHAAASARTYDLVVSILEPWSLVWAHQRRIRAIAVDNIFWHWGWDQHLLQTADRILKEVSDVDEALARLASLGEYAEYTPMYLVAARVLWQRVAPANDSLPARALKKVAFVQPLTPTFPLGPKAERLLVSLSGGLINPVATPQDWETYVNVLAEVVRPGLDAARRRGWQITVAAPRALCPATSDALVAEARPYGHDAFLDVVATARAIAAPMGLSTTIEAARARTALFTLPELHDGNIQNYDGLRRAAGVDPMAFDTAFPSSQLSADGRRRTIRVLYESYRKGLARVNEGFVAKGRARFEAFVERCADPAALDQLVRQQREVVLRATGGFGGLAQVATIVAEELAAARTGSLV